MKDASTLYIFKSHTQHFSGAYLRPCSIDPDSPVGNTLIVCAENSSAVLSILVGTAGSASSSILHWTRLRAFLLQVRLFVSITHSRTEALLRFMLSAPDFVTLYSPILHLRTEPVRPYRQHRTRHKLSGVPIITEGSPKSREYWHRYPGMPRRVELYVK